MSGLGSRLNNATSVKAYLQHWWWRLRWLNGMRKVTVAATLPPNVFRVHRVDKSIRPKQSVLKGRGGMTLEHASLCLSLSQLVFTCNWSHSSFQRSDCLSKWMYLLLPFAAQPALFPLHRFVSLNLCLSHKQFLGQH